MMHGQYIVNSDDISTVFRLRADEIVSLGVWACEAEHRKVLSFELMSDREPPAVGGRLIFAGNWFQILGKKFDGYCWHVTAIDLEHSPMREYLVAVPSLPIRHDDGGYIYVFTVGDCVVKVGMTANPRERFEAHIKQAKAFGAKITNAWLSDPHQDYRASEKLLIRQMADKAVLTIGNERFVGVCFDDAVDLARSAVEQAKVANG